MLPLNQFVPTLCTAIPRFAQHMPNQNQQDCIHDAISTPLMIVAGPGTGKTTVLVLRALRMVFVDGLMPEQIVITTFTKKAASELRSRLIEWGSLVKAYLEQHPPTGVGSTFVQWLDSIDINRFITGTLDKLCEEILTTHRAPTDPAPVLVEGFVGNALLALQGLFPSGAHNNTHLNDYLALFTHDGNAPGNFGEKLSAMRTLIDRLIQDEVDLVSFASDPNHQNGRQAVVNALSAYLLHMNSSNRMDFARLEQLFLERLRLGGLSRFTDGVRALLVDEYQDTNPLQESIYFEIVRQTGGSFTVVGDDDQSLYRFRGATVELFRDFAARLTINISYLSPTSLRYLVDNYRSTPEIVHFFNDFIINDPGFAPARVTPPKPHIRPTRLSNQIPVLGMFRPDINTLADDLSQLLIDVFQGTGYRDRTGTVLIERDPQYGDCGDAVMLAHTVNEFASAFGDTAPRARLPHVLRHRLQNHGIGVFNPRGRALRDIPEVQSLVGVMLECIDPNGTLQTGQMLRAEASRYMNNWRDAGRRFVATNPLPNIPHTLDAFVRCWQTRIPQTTAQWPSEWPVLELCFKLISWIPYLHDDPEGQVYLEALTRCIAQASTFSSYRSLIMYGQGIHDNKSVEKAIFDIFVPLAEGAVDVDEDILPHIPRGILPIMTIHQAKGLEFPLVIVDVSSDYKTNHPLQRFRRFPESPSSVQNLEDDLAPHCAIGALRMSRPPLDRTFDDLIRLNYVAYSRPQSALLLVGVDKCLQYSTAIKNIATCWRRDETWSWQAPFAGRRPPALANNIPLTLI